MTVLSGARVVVTGGSRGLGRGIAVAFGAAGARVHVGYRARRREAEETVAEVTEQGGFAQPFQVDLRDGLDVQRAFDALRVEEGGFDVLVNNAAVARDGLFPLDDDGDWHEVMATNLMGTVRCCRAAATAMWRARAGAIVNVASVAGLRASPGQASYAASKGAVLSFTRTLAAELAPRGIRVNAVVPGLLATGMGTRLDQARVAAREKQIPLGRLGTAAEVADAVVFLASPAARYIVGEALVVDGGLSL